MNFIWILILFGVLKALVAAGILKALGEKILYSLWLFPSTALLVLLLELNLLSWFAPILIIVTIIFVESFVMHFLSKLMWKHALITVFVTNFAALVLGVIIRGMFLIDT